MGALFDFRCTCDSTLVYVCQADAENASLCGLFCHRLPDVLPRGRLDLAVLFTPSTPNRQNRNQVRWNICAGVRRSTTSSEVVQTEQSRDLFQKRWRITACMRGYILYRLIYSGVLRVPSFTCLGGCSGVRRVL